MTKRKKNSYKHWTKEDIDYLEHSFGLISNERIAKKLGRTVLAVQKKAESLFATRKKSLFEGYLTTQELGEILGVHKATVARWIREYNFPCKVYKKTSGNSLNPHVYAINPDDVWKWVENNRDKMNIFASQIQRGVILPEPDWLIEDIENNVWYGKAKKWTEEMKEQLYKYYYEDGLKLREIAEKMGRTLPAIQKQIRKIREEKLGV